MGVGREKPYPEVLCSLRRGTGTLTLKLGVEENSGVGVNGGRDGTGKRRRLIL